MGLGKTKFVASGSYSIVAIYKTPSGALKVKTFGPYTRLNGEDGALDGKRKILSENPEMVKYYMRKQLKFYVVPMYEYKRAWT